MGYHAEHDPSALPPNPPSFLTPLQSSLSTTATNDDDSPPNSQYALPRPSARRTAFLQGAVGDTPSAVAASATDVTAASPPTPVLTPVVTAEQGSVEAVSGGDAVPGALDKGDKQGESPAETLAGEEKVEASTGESKVENSAVEGKVETTSSEAKRETPTS